MTITLGREEEYFWRKMIIQHIFQDLPLFLFPDFVIVEVLIIIVLIIISLIILIICFAARIRRDEEYDE